MNDEAQAAPDDGATPSKTRGFTRPWVVAALLLGAAAFFAGRTELARSLVVGSGAAEEAADLAAPRLVEAKAFSFRYPGNWLLDRSADDHDPERYLLIESPGGAMIIVMLLEGPLDPGSLLEDQVRDFEGRGLKVETRADFYEWGRLDGRGALLTGRILGVEPGAVRIFVGRNASRTLLFISQVEDSGRGLVQPGLELIAESFVMRERGQ